MPQQILKPDDERKPEAALPRFVYDRENIDRAAFVLERPHFDIAGAVDREVAGAPAIDIVSGNSGVNVPLGFHFFVRSGSRRAHIQSPLRTCKPAFANSPRSSLVLVILLETQKRSSTSQEHEHDYEGKRTDRTFRLPCFS